MDQTASAVRALHASHEWEDVFENPINVEDLRSGKVKHATCGKCLCHNEMAAAYKLCRDAEPTPVTLTRPAKAWIMLTRQDGKPLWIDYYMIVAVEGVAPICSDSAPSVSIVFGTERIHLYASDAAMFLKLYEGFVRQFHPIEQAWVDSL